MSPTQQNSGRRCSDALFALTVHIERLGPPFYDFAIDHDFLDAVERRQIVHGVQKHRLHDRAQTTCAGLAQDCFLGDRPQGVVGKLELHALYIEQALVLLQKRVLRPSQDLDQSALVQILQGSHDRQAAHELWDEAVPEQILRLEVAQDLARAPILGTAYFSAEADRRALPAHRDDLVEAGECTATDEQDVRRVDLQEFLLWMLAPTLRWHGGHGAFHDLQQRLLHSLA